MNGQLLVGLVFVSLLGATTAGAAPIYVFRQLDGTIRFTDRTPPSGVTAKVFTGKRASYSVVRFSSSWRRGYSVHKAAKEYDEIITVASREHQVDPALVKAVIHAESAFNPRAVSRKGAIGLMQLMPDTARWLGVRKPFAAIENIQGGARYLALLLRKYGGNLTFALAAYNAGEVAVERYQGVPPYDETQSYVRKVLALKDRYSARG